MLKIINENVIGINATFDGRFTSSDTPIDGCVISGSSHRLLTHDRVWGGRMLPVRPLAKAKQTAAQPRPMWHASESGGEIAPHPAWAPGTCSAIPGASGPGS